MAFFEERIISDAIEINAPAEKVFNYLTSIVDDATYRAWHEKDHVSFKWLLGEPWSEGSVFRAEEFLHGKLHKFTCVVTKVEINRRIEYAPVSKFLKLFLPKSEFLIEPKDDRCLFVASGTYRIGWIGKKFFHRAIEKGLASVKKHMKEEGENIKQALE